jgi:hypothetical protein
MESCDFFGQRAVTKEINIMPINLDKMKEKLEAANNKNKTSNKLFWKLPNGNSKVRVLPTEDGDPFKSFFFHYGVGNESLLCPKANFGETCAICDFVAHLYKDKSAESIEMAKKIMKKQRFCSPVLVRGEEKEGPKVWTYSKTVYQKLLQTALNPEYGDFTDPENGLDIDIVYGKKDGKQYPDTDLTFARKESKLCKDLDKKACEEMLKNLPDFNNLYKKKTPAEIQTALDAFLAGEPDTSSSSESETQDSEDEGSGLDDAIKSLQS